MSGDPELLELDFAGEIWCWRRPSPYYFVSVPEAASRHLHEVSRAVTYGWE